MADVNINKFRASVVRDGSKPASPGFIVSEGQSPVDPAGTGQNHLPVTITTAATGLSITPDQVLGGAGSVGQYIRGDGSLADFPESSGGGSSVSYYLNGSISQGTIGGVAYKELNKVPILGAGTNFTINADGYIAQFLTDAGDPHLLEIAGGNWNFETYFSASSMGGTPSFYVELYKYDGTTFTLIASSSSAPEFIAFGTITTPYFSSLAVPTTALTLTDRLAVRFYVTHSGRTITLHTENNTLCQIVTTFTTGLTSLNGLTAQVQNLAVGTSGTDFAIVSATATHTFNLPTASATNRGALSSADWALFTQAYNDKINSAAVTGTTTKTLTLTQQDGGTITASWSDLNTDAVTSVFGRTGAVVAANGDYTTAQVTESGNLYYTDARSRAALSFAAGSGAYNTSTGVITIPTNNNQITNGAGYITSAALAGYLPLTGGTLTGPLGGTTISLSGDITANRYRGVNSLVLNSYTTVNPSSNVYLYSPPNDRDAWIYLDSADTGSNWGIYHRQINSAVSGLPANSIGFVGAGSSTLQAWISLANGNGYFAGSLTAANLSGTNTGDVTIGTANGLSLSGQALSLGLASGSANGALSSTDWTTFNNKQNALTLTTTGTSGAATLVGATLNIPQYQAAGTYVTSVTASSPLFSSGGTTPNITIQQASGSQSGFLSSTDWTTFNNKQNALTNPVTGTGNTNYLAKFTSNGSTIGNSNVQDTGSAVIVDSHLNVNGGDIRFDDERFVYSYAGGSIGQYRSGIYFDGSGLTQRFFINNAESMRIFNDGNVLIQSGGTFTNNGARLQVSGRAYINNVGGSVAGTTIYGNDQSNVRLRLENVNGRTWELTGGLTGANNSDFTIYDVTAAATRLTIASTGAATFSSSVTVATDLTLNSGTLFVSAGSGQAYSGRLSTAYIFPWITTYLDSFAGPSWEGRLQFRTNSGGGAMNTHMTILNNGNVGIGTPSPTFRFDVETSNLTVGRFFSNASGKRNNILIQNSANWNYGVMGVVSATGSSNGDVYGLGYSASGSTAFTDVLNWTSTGNVLIGTQTDNGSKLRLNGSLALPHVTKSANYTLDATDYTVGFDCASNRTANLPDSTTCAGRIYVIYQYNTGSGARSVTLDGNGSQTINGSTTYSLSPYCDFSSVMIQSNGSNWIIIASNLTADCL